jgi:hypothetical protein
MQLDNFLKSKIRWHLGYNTTSIPAGDLARLEEALNNVPVNNNSVPRNRLENIAGDVDRTITTTDFKETLKTWTEIYLYETDRLALHLYVANYRNPMQARYRFEREGAEFIQALPGPADTAIGTRFYYEYNLR